VPAAGASSTYWALTTTWQLAFLPSAPQYCRCTPTDCLPCLGRLVSSSTSTPPDRLAATSPRTRSRSSAAGSQSASVSRCCSRSVEVPATAAAIASQFLRGRSVNSPVTYRSSPDRLSARRNSGASGFRYAATSGNGAGDALGTATLCITTSGAASIPPRRS
jgi:hypothetical protein